KTKTLYIRQAEVAEVRKEKHLELLDHWKG
ncbi:hypothetical protein HKBW3S06_01331, partial [Candidatus Hakubella thermalkaliphila]